MPRTEIADGEIKRLRDRDFEWGVKCERLRAERDALLAALKEIASHDTGMRPDFSVGAKQAAIARAAIKLAEQDIAEGE